MSTTRHRGNLASTDMAGNVELATPTEVNVGTDPVRVPSVDALAGSVFGEKALEWHVFDDDVAVTVGNGKEGRVIPLTMNGMDLVTAVAAVTDKGITDTTDIMVRRSRNGADADMLSAAITIGDEWFATDGGIGSNDDVITGDVIFIDVDAIHSGTAPNGLYVTLIFRLP